MVMRLPVAAFGGLVVATIGAFFVTQHLKVSTPLIAGLPRPSPAWINPVSGKRCPITTGTGQPEVVSYRRMRISFYLLNRSDHVDVYVVNASGNTVATLATDRFMRGGARPVRSLFVWDGRETDGRVAPDGTYYIRVLLRSQNRSVEIVDPGGDPEPVTVRVVAPAPVITDVAPTTISAPAPVTIDYRGNEELSGRIFIYRLERGEGAAANGGGKLALVKTFATRADADHAVWDGRIHGRPAPAGTYQLALAVTDPACNTGTFPLNLPPRAGASPGVVVR